MYLIFFTGVVVAGVALLVGMRVRMVKANIRNKLVTGWGKPKTENFNFDLISRYTFINHEENTHCLSSQTLQDIDFPELFCFLDRTTSRIGQQYLFDKLRRPQKSVSELEKFRMLTVFYFAEQKPREAVQQQLYRLHHPDTFHLCSLLQENLLARPSWFYIPIISTVIFFSFFLLGFFKPLFFVLMIVPFATNMLVHFWNKSVAFRFVKSLSQLGTLMQVSAQLLKHSKTTNPDVHAALNHFAPIRKKLLLINLSEDTGISGELSQFGIYIAELVKAIFLIEFYALFYLMKELEDKRKQLSILFKFVGEIDAAISVASLMAGKDKVCMPVLSSHHSSIECRGIYHPLVDQCVSNSLTLETKGILITGSNMAGKSTFLRTVVINSILAQTVYLCFAESFSSPFVNQFTSIRIDDSLSDGKSFYFEEVNTIKVLMEQASTENTNLFILDEVFKGTNTIERVAAAKAILEYLNRNGNFVLVSTHDLELITLLSGSYVLFHFAETIEDGVLRFDHVLKPGPTKTRNAIRILELSGYPREVIQEADSICKNMLSREVKTIG